MLGSKNPFSRSQQRKHDGVAVSQHCWKDGCRYAHVSGCSGTYVLSNDNRQEIEEAD